MFDSFGHGVITIAGMILAAIIMFDITMHPQAATSLLSTGSSFVTTETSSLLAR